MRPGHQQEFSCCLLLLAMNTWKAAWNQGWPHKMAKWQSSRRQLFTNPYSTYSSRASSKKGYNLQISCLCHAFALRQKSNPRSCQDRFEDDPGHDRIEISRLTADVITDSKTLNSSTNLQRENPKVEVLWSPHSKNLPGGPCSHHHHGCVRILPQAWAASPARVASYPQKGDPPAKFCGSLEQGWLTCKKD